MMKFEVGDRVQFIRKRRYTGTIVGFDGITPVYNSTVRKSWWLVRFDDCQLPLSLRYTNVHAISSDWLVLISHIPTKEWKQENLSMWEMAAK